MAFQDFWMNVRRGARFLFPRASLDSPHLDGEAIERELRNNPEWLTPRSVAGFQEGDLDFLPEAERDRLAELVRQFREIFARSGRNPYSQVIDLGPLDEAIPVFREIIESLAFDRYEDAEAFQIGKRIEREIEPFRPPELQAIQFRTYDDHTGDPALWIRAILTDESSQTDEEFLQNAKKIRELLDPVARHVVPDRWPYFSIRPSAEHIELVETP